MSAPELTEFEREFQKFYGRLPTGGDRHWCHDWDGLPIDDTTEEYFSCHCEDADGVCLAAIKRAGSK